MIKHDAEPSLGMMQRACAFSVHIFSASGAALGLLALIAAVRGDWTWMFVWLGIALAVDALDGPLARRLRVAERLPAWSGDSLDLVVDFVTYVFIPAYALAVSGLLPSGAAIPLAALIVVTSALYCADRRMKTAENYFRGFPVLWNAVAFYLFILKPSPWIAAAGVIVLVLLTFAPFRFIHPVRVVRWRRINILLLMLWAGLAALALAQNLNPAAWVAGGLCLTGLYFVTIGLLPSSSKNG
jgi:phosphatidylcholine synthase